MILQRVFAGAAGLWQRDRDLWVRVAGVFFFLPALALQLFVPPPGVEAAANAVAGRALLVAWFSAYGPHVLAYLLFQTFGYAVVLSLVLDRSAPTLGAAMVRGLRLMPGFLLTVLAVGLSVWVGLSLFIVPGIYLLGRLILAWPILAAEPERSALGALLASVQRSNRRGWQLALATASTIFGSYILFLALAAIAVAAGATPGNLVRLVFDVTLSALWAASSLGFALLQAAIYRELGGAPRQGI